MDDLEGGFSFQGRPQRRRLSFQNPTAFSQETERSNVFSQYAFEARDPLASAYARPGNTQVQRNEYRELAYDGGNASLDDYDRALLAEPYQDRHWQASRGINRLSLPPRPADPQPGDGSYGLPSARGFLPSSSTGVYQDYHQDQENRDLPEYPLVRKSSGTVVSATRRPLSSFSSRYLPDSSSPSGHVQSSPSFHASQRRRPRGPRQEDNVDVERTSEPRRPMLDLPHAFLQPSKKASNHGLPMVQGIQLVSLLDLPDRFRSLFHFPLFNAVQSKCFEIVYKSDDNLVLSAPTGSGKTVLLELAICRLVSGFQSDQYKIVYMAPTKSLCSERQRDWQLKFRSLGLDCAELTGDTDQAQLRNVQSANIIITTPEKWDSMTRKWKDHAKLMQLVKLFLIDEVHILKETRGATLEAVVSRMKSVGSSVRFVALSATVPNSEDIATWLGKDPTHQYLPAQRERFGEEFRPVTLQKFVYGLAFRGNDFAFDTICDSKLPDLIAKHSAKKPIMVFCCTRKSTMSTAKLLANRWMTSSPRDRQWPVPSVVPAVFDAELKATLASGVAFHHAGLDGFDRQAVEKGFLDGNISVICCTSTLAVGVNLPCHLVIIKNTVSWQDEGLKEYADLEMMQMLGRAGRPQFDTTAVAIIITRQEKVKRYERLVSGEEVLESCLHLNLIDHLNAEIGLGTVHDLHTAKKWLGGTFLFVRLAQNPSHYKLEGDAKGRSLDERIEQICERDIHLLQETNLVLTQDKLRSTAFGEAMTRYYVKFETMRALLSLPPKAKMSEILSVLVEAEEFHEVRYRSGEKSLYKALNSASGIKFPIKIDIALPTQKRSIIIQAELGGVDFPPDEQFGKHKKQYQQDRAILFSHIHRLIRCVIDCQVQLQDAPATRHALELARSLSTRVWDNSPLQMKQVPNIGPVAVRKLVTAGINSLEALEEAEPHRINMLLSKQPGFGEKIINTLKGFPKLRVSIKVMGKDLKHGQLPRIRLKAELGFLNEKVPVVFIKKPVYVCFMAERSDGNLIDFRRMGAKSISNGDDVLLSAELSHEDHYITCYVMCDEIAGTMRYAELKPSLPASVFPPRAQPEAVDSPVTPQRPESNISRRRSGNGAGFRTSLETYKEGDGFDDGIDDTDLVAAADQLEFNTIEEIERRGKAFTNSTKSQVALVDEDWEPERLGNGKWACNHKCKDKSACKHLCCREGVDKAPRAPKRPSGPKEPSRSTQSELAFNPNKTSISTTFKINRVHPIENRGNSKVEVLDMTSGRDREEYAKYGPREFRKLNELHKSVVRVPPARLVGSKQQEPPREPGEQPSNPFLINDLDTGRPAARTSTDYGGSDLDDFPSPSAFLKGQRQELDHERRPSLKTPKRFSALGAGFHEREGTKGYEGREYSSESSIPLDDTQPVSREDDFQHDEIDEDYFHDFPDAAGSRAEVQARSPSRPPGHSSLAMRSQDESLFLSTDSPKQFPSHSPSTKTQHQKRSQDIQDNDDPPAKRAHIGLEESRCPLEASVYNHNQTPVSEMKNKLQPWEDMTGIDMDLLAEYADYVEFV